MSEEKIVVKGARVHNLKNLSIDIPRDQFIVITGVSGSGKSSLAFDTLFAEGQRRYVESLSAYARQFLGRIKKPDVDLIEGIPPAIAIEQKVNTRNPVPRWEHQPKFTIICVYCMPGLEEPILPFPEKK